MSTKELYEKRAANARRGRAEKRKAPEPARADAENEGGRVSARTVKKLRMDLDAERERGKVFEDSSNTYRRQRNNQYQTVRRLRGSSQVALAVQDAEHQTTVDGHIRRISDLESRLSASEATVDNLRRELKSAEQRLKYHLSVRDHYCAQEVKKAVKRATSFNLKESGIYTDSVRSLVADLVCDGRVGTGHVDFVIRAVLHCAGLTVTPGPGADFRRTVGRCVGEGGLASKHQVAKKLNDAGVTAVCLSGDGTTHRNLNIMGRHVTVTNNGVGETLCLGVTRPVDHSADTTFREWLEELQDIGTIYDDTRRACDLSETEEFCLYTLFDNIRATASDHAADQVAFADQLQDHRMKVGFAARGIRAMRALRPIEFQALMCDEKSKMIARAGGIEAWLRLPTTRHRELEREMLEDLRIRLGKAEFDALSPSEQALVRFFIRSGCCMHKDLNAVVYGNKRMMAAWAQAGLPGPVKLHNRDNAAAVRSGSSEASARAEEVSQGGGVKAASLFGLLFNSSDDKQGYAELYRHFLEEKFTKCPWIPNTHACRFQSNYEMARFMLRYRDHSLEFMGLQWSKKTQPGFNNLETNVWSALHDGATLSELAALALYGTTIGRPYMSRVRETGLVDMTELGPLHLAVIAQCDLLATCPEVCRAGMQVDGTVPASLFGQPLDDPELLPILQSLSEQGLLPHLDVAISAFFAGTADGWRHFSQEFLPGGSISSATTEQLAAIVIPATNDTCESLVGGYCVEKRGAPAMCTPFFNAKTMFRRNHTSPYLKGLAPGLRGHLRREHRRRDALGLPKLEKRRQLAFERKKAAEGRAAEARREEKRQKLQRDLDLAAATRFLSLGAMLDFEARRKLTGPIIASNLLWHKHRGRADVQARYKATTPKPTLVRQKRALLYAVLEHMLQPAVEGAAIEGFNWQELISEGSGEQGTTVQPADLWE